MTFARLIALHIEAQRRQPAPIPARIHSAPPRGDVRRRAPSRPAISDWASI